ncbi:signal peptidase II [Ornithinimicrobium sufpigmenti]|uniref:signal peptidase II n=1 Tax=Ornithinimicrobium sufpigmenti TaxID=2508882 RepID=UPI001035D0F2|nr:MULTISPECIES: signal peptidase II [unclassified Ornithinimicrobium]
MDAQLPARTPARTRAALCVGAGAVAVLDLGGKAWAERALATRRLEAGPVDLVLGYNPGVAFSLGADAPAALVLTVTGLVIATIAALAWRAAPTWTPWRVIAVAAVLGGALGNFIDRALDGVVTDYLHTGWWPTFNLADTAIVTGAVLLVLLELRPPRHPVRTDTRG